MDEQRMGDRQFWVCIAMGSEECGRKYWFRLREAEDMDEKTRIISLLNKCMKKISDKCHEEWIKRRRGLETSRQGA